MASQSAGERDSNTVSKKEERYIIIAIIIAVLSCVAGWLALPLALPQVQDLLNTEDSTSTPSSLKLDGVWRGRTSEEGEIYFKVTGEKITELSSDFVTRKVSNASPCPPSGSFGSKQAYIESNSFTQIIETTHLRIEIKGEFESSTVANGTLSSPSEPFDNAACDVVYTAWTARKQ